MRSKTCMPIASADSVENKRAEIIQRVVGLLMSYQIIFPGYFGDDDEFVDLALRTFFEIVRS